MKPKEKAEELFNNYRQLEINGNGQIKKSVLIAIDEIINVISKDYIRVNNNFQTVEYWEEVKEQLKNI